MNHAQIDQTRSLPEPQARMADGTAGRLGHPLLELRWYGELARLLTDPVMCGRGVPRGDGRSVLLLPGFLAGDSSLSLLALFLRRIGYRPIQCEIWFNSGCFATFDRRMVDQLVGAHDRSGRRVAIIGHSRGGHFARSLAARHPNLVSHAVVMGTGLEDPLDVSALSRWAATAAQTVLHTGDPRRAALGCLTAGCTCMPSQAFTTAVPDQVRMTSIFSRTDGVVRWLSCVADYASCVEVPGSHLGMICNRHAYRAVAQALAEPSSGDSSE
jgi:pimeloyl-ACP methyl ester carboxylesterase